MAPIMEPLRLFGLVLIVTPLPSPSPVVLFSKATVRGPSTLTDALRLISEKKNTDEVTTYSFLKSVKKIADLNKVQISLLFLPPGYRRDSDLSTLVGSCSTKLCCEGAGLMLSRGLVGDTSWYKEETTLALRSTVHTDRRPFSATPDGFWKTMNNKNSYILR